MRYTHGNRGRKTNVLSSTNILNQRIKLLHYDEQLCKDLC